MAEIWPRDLVVDGRAHRVRLVFRSRLLRWLPIGGIVLSAGTVRFKRSPEVVPRHLVAHEIGHVIQAHRLGWRYLPTYLVHKDRMEAEADDLGRRLEANQLPGVPRPAWLDRFGR